MDIKYVIATKYDALQTERDELAAMVNDLRIAVERLRDMYCDDMGFEDCSRPKILDRIPAQSLQANNALVNNAAVDGCATWLRDNGWFSDDGNALAAMCESVKIQGE